MAKDGVNSRVAQRSDTMYLATKPGKRMCGNWCISTEFQEVLVQFKGKVPRRFFKNIGRQIGASLKKMRPAVGVSPPDNPDDRINVPVETKGNLFGTGFRGKIRFCKRW